MLYYYGWNYCNNIHCLMYMINPEVHNILYSIPELQRYDIKWITTCAFRNKRRFSCRAIPALSFQLMGVTARLLLTTFRHNNNNNIIPLIKHFLAPRCSPLNQNNSIKWHFRICCTYNNNDNIVKSFNSPVYDNTLVVKCKCGGYKS